MNKISQGAEATLYREGDIVVKHRSEKSYRHKDIDAKLRKSRTRREAKVLGKLKGIGFPVPGLINMDDKDMKIEMEFVNGDKLRDVLHKDYKKLSREIGKKVGVLHKNNIIHGDLTTSNMMLDGEIKFIDFGLSFFSTHVEDKAVDLHLLRRALASKHHEIFEECFDEVVKGYKEECADAIEVLNRLEKVESRGRNKGKH